MRHCLFPDKILELGEIGFQELAAAEKIMFKDRQIEFLLKAARKVLKPFLKTGPGSKKSWFNSGLSNCNPWKNGL